MHVAKMAVMKAVFIVNDYVYFQYYTIIEEYFYIIFMFRLL